MDYRTFSGIKSIRTSPTTRSCFVKLLGAIGRVARPMSARLPISWWKANSWLIHHRQSYNIVRSISTPKSNFLYYKLHEKKTELEQTFFLLSQIGAKKFNFQRVLLWEIVSDGFPEAPWARKVVVASAAQQHVHTWHQVKSSLPNFLSEDFFCNNQTMFGFHGGPLSGAVLDEIAATKDGRLVKVWNR